MPRGWGRLLLLLLLQEGTESEKPQSQKSKKPESQEATKPESQEAKKPSSQQKEGRSQVSDENSENDEIIILNWYKTAESDIDMMNMIST